MKSLPPIIGIMAATKQGVIGHNNKLPWHDPEELAYFCKMTEGKNIIMGQTTYDAGPAEFFRSRKSIVLSRNPTFEATNATVCRSLESCLSHLRNHCSQEPVFMVGGAEVTHLFLKNNLINHFLLTEMHTDYPGDTRLDLSYFNTWQREVVAKKESHTIYLLHNPKARSY